MERDKLITWPAVEAMIAEGHIIVIYEGNVLRLDSWLEKHPGGRLAILHMVGRDATDEINVYHPVAVCNTMKAYRIGRLAGPWINMTPPIRGGVYPSEKTSINSRLISEEPDDCNSNVDEIGSTSSLGLPSDQTSLTSACSSADEDELLGLSSGVKPSSPETGVRRRLQREGLEGTVSDAACPATTNQISLTPAQFTDLAVQNDIKRGIRDYPPLDPAVQQDIIQKYRVLQRRIEDEGLYECPYLEYAKELIRYTVLFTISMVALYYRWYMTSATFLGLFWHQIMFTAHDAGHTAITHNFVFDSLIAIFIADFCCGLSMGWWKSSHNVHHLVTNQPEHDPDIQNIPLFATCPSFFRSLRSTYYDFTFIWDAAAEFLVPYQKYTYYPVMGIARFNLYLLSWLHVLSRKSWRGRTQAAPRLLMSTEIAFMACYWFLFGYLLLWRALPTWTVRVAFVLVSHVVTMPLHVQITLSHWGMSTADLGESESFPQRQLRTTMDVDCPAWLDFVHGGLQFQAVHHLFPRLPRHNLRRAQVLVREFCSDTGIPYSILGFVDGNGKVLSRLDEVAEQVAHLIACQKHMAATGESGLI
ncbi:hypothetical protein DL766_003064 [Monosporascus sp. MC13-8B]|uniref:Delta 8-(E)-sphingolipid desaturase n=1 Tax=Monosporascus cannonballus TaxID=155416 RepID=A0ABY0HA41_9PEZI|nr:hypothetical protein DL762_003771 [Monosporascus cannonballus]RYO96301.1 hypothetical protein DL763_003274 [Monosporascus cannonballus]RYP34289.1 hypothetical protein DL766_003064 [Monosporascus sp. MC13-8B]